MIAATLLLTLPCAPLAPGEGDLYRRAVARALQRTQAELLSTATAGFLVDHSRWEDPWVVTTDHYEVRATVSYAQTRKLADELEFMRGEFIKLLGEGQPIARKLPVWIFPRLQDYTQFGVQHGAEHSSMLGSFYSSPSSSDTPHPDHPVAAYQIGNSTWLGMWVTHSALHQFLEESFGPQREVWVDEGLASYFALFWDWSYGAKELERIERSPSFVPLERLVQEPLQAYLANPNDRFIELGMLFQFLLNSWEPTRNGAGGDPASGPFQEFLRAAVRGQDVRRTEFVQTFEEAADDMETDFKRFEFAKQ